MKALLNTLYVTVQGAWLAQDGDTVAVRVEQETRLRVPIRTLTSIVCFGHVSCTPFLMNLCAEHGVALSFLTEHGRFLAGVRGPTSGNVLLRRQQYRLTDLPETATLIARTVVLAKVANCRLVLQRAARDSGSGSGRAALLSTAVLRLKRIVEDVEKASTVDSVRGHEGDAARTYFEVFDQLISGDKEHFFFRGRSRRPPLDNMNALLSFLYTLLTNDMTGALESVGLDPAVGYLHRERPGRPSLALDLVEELRPVLADRLALTLVNRRELSKSGFRQLETGGIVMDEETRKQVLVAWQERKKEEVLHPYLNEKVPIGLIPYVQSLLLARYIRGDLDGYPCFFWK